MPEQSGRKTILKTDRAGLVLPVPRFNRGFHARFKPSGRVTGGVGDGFTVCATATIEYAIAELMQASLNTARKAKRTRVLLSDVSEALRSDHELASAFSGFLISAGEHNNGISKAILCNADKKKREYDRLKSIEAKANVEAGKSAFA